jgi:hypothetical protein
MRAKPKLTLVWHCAVHCTPLVASLFVLLMVYCVYILIANYDAHKAIKPLFGTIYSRQVHAKALAAAPS